MPRPRKFGPRVLRGYYFNRKAKRFMRVKKPGGFVSRAKINALLERSIHGREQRLFEGARRAVDGDVNPKTWLARSKTLIKRQYLQNAALAAGGWDQMTPADYGRLGGKLRAQYRRLAVMAEGIADGIVSQAQAVNRMRMYMGNARMEYLEQQQANIPPPPAGEQTIERRFIDPSAEHCPQCPGYADAGWQPKGTLPVPGAECDCNGNCRCSIVYKNTKEPDEWLGTKKGGRGRG